MSGQNHSSRLEQIGATLVLTPTMDLSELNIERFAQDVQLALQMIDSRRAANVVLDFNKTSHIGSNAVSLLLKVRRHVLAVHGSLALCELSDNAREVLRVLNLDQLLPSYDTRREALQQVSDDTAHILVVDDSQVDRQLVFGLLRCMPNYRFSFAENGSDALEFLAGQPVDIVITDLIMPYMNGLELVEEVRLLHPRTPVVLMTAFGNESISLEALRRGASSYVPKSQQAERLLPTVERVLARSRAQSLQPTISGLPARLEGTFYLDNEPHKIPQLVDIVQQLLRSLTAMDATEQVRVGVALEEALLNAVYHGNLELSPEEWQRVRTDRSKDCLTEILEQRGPGTDDRRVTLDVHITPHSCRFVVRDDGPGFDPEEATSAASMDVEYGDQRGSTLMRTFMDEVRYNADGNEVTMIKLP